MKRFTNSPDLFGAGVGRSTFEEFTCGICREVCNEGSSEEKSYHNDGVQVTTFAGISVCGDCFGEIEHEVFSRMPNIISWYTKILVAKESIIKREKAKIATLTSFLSGELPQEEISLSERKEEEPVSSCLSEEDGRAEKTERWLGISLSKAEHERINANHKNGGLTNEDWCILLKRLEENYERRI